MLSIIILEMWIPVSALVAPDDPWVKKWCVRDPCVVELKGLSVRVGGTKGQFSSMTPELIAAMPSLRALAPGCGGLRTEVRNRLPVDGELAAFIDYRGGRRTVESYFNGKAAFINGPPPWRDPQCLANTMRYEAEINGSEALLTFTERSSGREHEVRIKGDSTLEVRHVPENEEPGHFGYAYSIFKPEQRCKGLLPTVYDEFACDSRYEPTTKIASPFPQADCTNTGYP